MTSKEEIEATEARLQQDIWREINNKYCLVHHAPRHMIMSIPNAKSKLFSATGMYPGAADLLVLYRAMTGNLRIIFMEVKTPAGKQSNAQIDFEAHCTQTGGVEYHIVRSVEDALAVIDIDA